VTWSLEQMYDAYPQVEEEFSAALDQSPHPRGCAGTGPAISSATARPPTT
jgi:hypothetical protein